MWALLRRASTNSLIAPGLNTAAFRACAGLGPINIQKEDKSAAVKPHFPTLDRWITSKTCNYIVPVPERFSVGFRFLSSQAGVESGGEETLKTDLLEDTEGDAGKITLSGLSALSTLVFEESSESISGALNNFFEGKEISRSEVYQALLNFRKHKLFEKAFQLLAWLEGRADFDFSGRDYASMVDLIAKVHGLQKAEVYLDNIPKSFREEVIFRASLANYVSATLKKSNQLKDKMDSSGMACFVESPTSDNANDLRFMGREKTSLLFPFFGATFFFQRDGLRVYNKLTLKDAREQLLGQLRKKCWNLMGKEALVKLTKKSIDQDGMRELMKGTEMLTEIILKNKRIPYGYNSYLNEVKRMRNILSNRTSTDTIIESVKIRSVYQSAAMIAQDVCTDLKKKNQSFRSIFSRIVRMVPVGMKKSGSRVEGIRICVSGRLRGAEIAKTECGKYGKTSCNTITQKMDYAAAEASTRYGNLGVKVWISYSSS